MRLTHRQPGRKHLRRNYRGSFCTLIAWNCDDTRIMNDIRLLRHWLMTLGHGWRHICPKGWKYYMQGKQYAPDCGHYANLSADEKKKRLDAMVRIWQGDTERRIEREGYRAFIKAVGLDEYRYSVWLRFPEWERPAVVGQVIALQRSQ